MTSPSETELIELVSRLLPTLTREIGIAQDEIRSAENRLKRLPSEVLQNGAKSALSNAIGALGTANESVVKGLESLHHQYPNRT